MLTRSKSMSDTKISITKEELDEAIQKALKVVDDLYKMKLAMMQQRLHQQGETTSQLKEEVNRLEQYSRRSHLRIRGLKLEHGQNCKEAEDLTSTNIKLLKALKACSKVDSAWSWNGKIFAKLTDSYLQQTNNPVFDFVPITPTEIDIIVDNIKPKHSTGYDDISTTLIKHLKFELRTPLTLIVN
ncbi:hypothetical protein CAPTEDRAFT_205623 [Capitella teleta]|uniref:Uncharacterized protein n=1 Tax=Capitella teleta TaxID=283909 RepID=R7VJX1_CAPTE|nr:hypothetical protein CAPTEDRAFT_205623 [Capitella teleta]|eukprot:ELU16270.1 hypothetical protein CAPTEDRAFT_205623 [Capitella teleta]